MERKDRAEARQYPRFRLEVEVTIYSPSAGPTPGQTIEISERGMSAILPLELPLGEIVECHLRLPLGGAQVRAAIRNRNIFRHGFEFVQPRSARDVMKETFDAIARSR